MIQKDNRVREIVKLMLSDPSRGWCYRDIASSLNMELHGLSATLSSNKDIFKNNFMEETWSLAKDYEKHLNEYGVRKKDENEKLVSRLLMKIAGTPVQRKDDYKKLIDEDPTAGLKRKVRESAGCRKRCRSIHEKTCFGGPNVLFAAAHIIPYKTSSTIADNSGYNLLPLSLSHHGAYDKGLLEIHAVDEGLEMRVITDDPYYKKDGVVFQYLELDIREEVQKRVIIGNIARKVKQVIPPWFRTWCADIGVSL